MSDVLWIITSGTGAIRLILRLLSRNTDHDDDESQAQHCPTYGIGPAPRHIEVIAAASKDRFTNDKTLDSFFRARDEIAFG